jgi:hypothetical protein
MPSLRGPAHQSHRVCLDRAYVVREHVPQPFDMTRPLRQGAGPGKNVA